MKRVSILVPNYNTFEGIQLCVESIRARTDYRDYEIIVHDDESPNGIDVPYLEQAAQRGWIRLIKGEAKAKWREAGETYGPHIHKACYWHGRALATLLNEVCETDLAVVIEGDAHVKKSDWLDSLLALMDAETLIVASEGPSHHAASGLWVPGWYMMSFALVNMLAYRDGMMVDWLPWYGKMEGERARRVFGTPEKREVLADPGSSLWLKMIFDNPKQYRAKGIPRAIEQKRGHGTQVSVRMDGPGVDPEAIAGKHYYEQVMVPIHQELLRVRAEEVEKTRRG